MKIESKGFISRLDNTYGAAIVTIILTENTQEKYPDLERMLRDSEQLYISIETIQKENENGMPSTHS